MSKECVEGYFTLTRGCPSPLVHDTSAAFSPQRNSALRSASVNSSLTKDPAAYFKNFRRGHQARDELFKLLHGTQQMSIEHENGDLLMTASLPRRVDPMESDISNFVGKYTTDVHYTKEEVVAAEGDAIILDVESARKKISSDECEPVLQRPSSASISTSLGGMRLNTISASLLSKHYPTSYAPTAEENHFVRRRLHRQHEKVQQVAGQEVMKAHGKFCNIGDGLLVSAESSLIRSRNVVKLLSRASTAKPRKEYKYAMASREQTSDSTMMKNDGIDLTLTSSLMLKSKKPHAKKQEPRREPEPIVEPWSSVDKNAADESLISFGAITSDEEIIQFSSSRPAASPKSEAVVNPSTQVPSVIIQERKRTSQEKSRVVTRKVEGKTSTSGAQKLKIKPQTPTFSESYSTLSSTKPKLATSGVGSSIAGTEVQERYQHDIDKVSKYSWNQDLIMKAPHYPKPQFSESFKNSVYESYTGHVPRQNNSPTAREAIIFACSSYQDTNFGTNPQAVLDGVQLAQVLKTANFNVTLLASNAESLEFRPTLRNLMRVVSKACQSYDNGYYASLVVVFLGFGIVNHCYAISDQDHLRLIACEDSKHNSMNSYFPIDFLTTLHYERCLVCADVRGLHPSQGFGLVSCENIGGHLSFDYLPFPSFAELSGACHGALVGLLVKGLRGKASRDLRITPNSLNVYIAERLMTQRVKLYTTASPFHFGAWEIISQHTLILLRAAMRSFRLSKSRKYSSLKVGCLVEEHYARNMEVVQSQSNRKVRSKVFNMEKDYFTISSIYFLGELYLVFKTKDSYSMGIIEADGFCRRAFMSLSIGAEPVREAAQLRLRIKLPFHVIPQAVQKLRDYVHSRSLCATVFLSAEMCIMTTTRCERKLDAMMRMCKLAPYLFIQSMTEDKEQMKKILSAIVLQARWRCFILRKRYKIASVLLREYSTNAEQVVGEWRAWMEKILLEKRQHALNSCELEEQRERGVHKQYALDELWDISRHRAMDWSLIVTRGRASYAVWCEKSVPSTGSYYGRKRKGEDTDDETDTRVRIRNRMAIEYKEERARLWLFCQYKGQSLSMRQNIMIRPLEGFIKLPVEEMLQRYEVESEEHTHLQNIVTNARRYLLIASKLLKDAPVNPFAPM